MRKSAVPTAAELVELQETPDPAEMWRICVGCEDPFPTTEPRDKYCCPECRGFYAERRRAAREEARRQEIARKHRYIPHRDVPNRWWRPEEA